jgi:Mn-dependent DtxR family transcriptional regulator
MQVKDLSTEELKTLIKETVAEALQELLPDPDANKDLKPEVKQQLLEIQQRRASGIRGIPAAEVLEHLG